MRKNSVVLAVICLSFIQIEQVEACNPPKAIIAGGIIRSTCPGAAITFEGSLSSDDESIESYVWTFSDDQTTQSGSRVTHTFNSTVNPSYIVTLTVTDDEGLSATASCTVYVRPGLKTIWYVASSHGEDNAETHGVSWNKPFLTLQMALNVAVPGDQIWVKTGTYFPNALSSGDPRLASFYGGEGVSIYGGFVGNEEKLQDRKLTAQTFTCLSTINGGNDWPDGNRSDNCYRVISCDQVERIDGFTIYGGNADVPGHSSGAAFSGGNGTIFANCRFEQNYALCGGAVSTNGVLTFTNCVFSANRAVNGDGGAIWATGGVLTLKNCVFQQNEASSRGGGVYASNVDSDLTGCIFDRNKAGRAGGMIARDGSETTLINCTFSGNTGSLADYPEGAGFRDAPDTVDDVDITNCIFWGNSSAGNYLQPYQLYGDNLDVDHCCVQNWDGQLGGVNSGNTGSDPCFVNSATGDLHLKTTSLCRNAGNSAFVSASDTDIDGQSRSLDGLVDIGADEVYTTLYVDHTATGLDSGADWPNAFQHVGSALKFASEHPGVVSEIKVAKGLYYAPGYNRWNWFGMSSGITLIGGFQSGGGDRDLLNCETILSGRVPHSFYPWPTEEKLYHVVVAASDATIDGFIIRDGMADADSDTSKCGGGILAHNVNNFTVRNCRIVSNKAKAKGGAVYHKNALGVQYINCVFTDNQTTDAYGAGGAAYSDINSNVAFTNCTISGNTAMTTGGLCVADSAGANSFTELNNCIVWNNTDTSTETDALTAQIFGNTNALIPDSLVAVRYSCIGADGYTGDVFYGTENIRTSPSFLGQDNYHLSGDSSCIDAGLDALIPQGTDKDIEGNMRTFNVPGRGGMGRTVDMGAYEFTSSGGNQPPVAQNDTAVAIAGEPLEISVCQNDTDPDGDAIAVVWATLGIGGSVSLTEGGTSVIYTPAEWFTGQDTFSYTIQDTGGLAATASVTVNVVPRLEVYAGQDRTISSAVTQIQISDSFVRGPQGCTITWSVVYAPVGCNVNITPGNAEQPQITFEINPSVFATGRKVQVLLRLTATSQIPAYTAQDEVWITIRPAAADQAAPVVSITCGAVEAGTASLTGNVTDDGLPFGQLFYKWDVLQVPDGGMVRFAAGSNKDTTAAFTKAGTYLIRLRASDGQKEGIAVAAVVVPDGQTGKLTAYAGNDLTEESAITLHGSAVTYAMNSAWVKRDGVDVTEETTPPVNVCWRVIGGPAVNVVFSDAASVQPEVTFSAAEKYVLQIEAWDSSQRVFDDVQIVVETVDDELVVDAGPDLIAGQFETITLRGQIKSNSATWSLEDDWQRPYNDYETWIPSAVTYTNNDGIVATWSVISGPGEVKFLSFNAGQDEYPDAATPHVRCAKAGKYLLQLQVQVGTEKYTDTMKVTVPPMQVAIGSTHMLALDSSGSVWGRGFEYIEERKPDIVNNILSDCSNDSKAIVVAFEKIRFENGEELQGVSQVAAGKNTSFAVMRDSGQVLAFGDNRVNAFGDDLNGYLGVGSEDPFVRYPLPVTTSQGIPLQGIRRIVTATNIPCNYIYGTMSPHVLALDSDGKVWSWGCNDHGQLGTGEGFSRTRPAHVLVSGDPNQRLSGIVDIDAGQDHSIALDNNGNVWTWGYNGANGILGNGSTDYNCVLARKVLLSPNGPALSDIVDIATTRGDTIAFFAVSRDGSVWQWGESLEYWSADVVPYPQKVPKGTQQASGNDLSQIVGISAGDRHVIATTANGYLLAWGGPIEALGLGEAGNYQDTPVYVHAPVGSGETWLGGIVLTTAGRDKSVAIDADGNVWQWGGVWPSYIDPFVMGWSPDFGYQSSLLPKLTSFGYVTNLSKADKWYDTIQLAIDDADTDNVIVVHPGVYRRFKVPGTKSLHIQSVNPFDFDITRQTIVCGWGHGVANEGLYPGDVVVTLEPPSSSTIQGLTITGGGIGVLCGMIEGEYINGRLHYTQPVSNADDAPIVRACRIVQNSGSGIMCFGNACHPVLENNWINGYDEWHYFGWELPAYVLADPRSDGIYCESSNSTILNNTIVNNCGFGVYYTDEPYLAIYNCILSGNLSLDSKQTYRCTEQGCFTVDDPYEIGFEFISSPSGYIGAGFDNNYHLTAESVCCINSGDSSAPHPDFDIDGQPRVMGDCIDIGADEFTGWSVSIGADKRASRNQPVVFSDVVLRYMEEKAGLEDGRVATWVAFQKPDGSEVCFTNGNTLTPTVTFDTYGTYQLRLTISDSTGPLCADTVTVSVGPKVSITASSRVLVLPGDSSTTLTGEVEGWTTGNYTAEWSSSAPSVAKVSPHEGYPLPATVNVSRVGLYTITLTVRDADGLQVAEASTTIVANAAGVAVEAGDDQQAPPNHPVQLAGTVIGATDCTLKWYFPEGTHLNGNDSAIQTCATFSSPGTYDVILTATDSSGRFIGGDILTANIVDGAPVLDMESNDPDIEEKFAGIDISINFLVDPDPEMLPVDLNKWTFDRLEWRLNGRAADDGSWGTILSQGRPDATVSFRQPGLYSLLMGLYKDNVLIGFDTLLVTVKKPKGLVTAKISDGTNEYDEYSRVLGDSPVIVSLVGRSMILVPGAAEYEWSSDGPDAVALTGDDWGNKTATVSTAGLYHITLTAQLSGNVIGRDTVTLAVFPDQTICSAGRDYGTVFTGNELHLSKAFVWSDSQIWHGGESNPPSVTWTSTDSEHVLFEDSHAIKPKVTFTSPGIYTLTMACGDAHDSVDIIVEEPVLIRGFTITPNTLTSPGREITFSATMANDSDVQSWTIDMLAGGDMIVGTFQDTGNSVDVSKRADSIGVLVNGKYTARLTARKDNGATDVAYADIVLNTGVNPSSLKAELDSIFHVSKSMNPDDHSAKHVISKGICEIYGKAYSPTKAPVGFSVIVRNADGASRVVLQESGVSIGSDDGYGLLGKADLTGLPNGVYDIVLTVKFDNYYASNQGQFILNSPLKIGNLSFSQEDLSIPVGGYPISLIRTYDSLAKDTPGDFGYGWTYSFADMDIQLNEDRVGVCRSGGTFDRDVTLTMPDGTRVTFASRFDSSGRQWIANYDSPPGVTAKLETRGHDKIVYGGGYSGLDYFWLCDEGDFRPSGRCSVDLGLHDFSGFTLTLPDGTIYNIARHYYDTYAVNDASKAEDDYDEDTALYKFQSYGKPYLESIYLPTGEKIVFDVDTTDPEKPLVRGAKRYLAGQNTPIDAILLEREGDRIVAVYPPSETDVIENAERPGTYIVQPKAGAVPYVTYSYDPSGNLKSVSRLKEYPNLYETIAYSYTHAEVKDPEDNRKVLYKQCYTSEHRITAITDARGIDIVKYHYDETGLLAATEDASGGAIKIVHDKNNMKETITDRLGNVSEYEYDHRGRVTAETKWISGVPQTTSYTYGTAFTPQYRETEGGPNYYGLEYTNAFVDKPCMITGPDGSVTYSRYDSVGRLLMTIDPEMNATDYDYDDKGNVEWSRQLKLKRNGDGSVYYEGNVLHFQEVSTSRNYYTPNGLLYLSGTTTGDGASRVWHSASFTTYDDKNRIVRSVQLDVRSGTFASAFANGGVLEYDELDEYDISGCPTTTYVYDDDISVDQPSSVIDASGTETHFHYNDQGAQDASWYEAAGADGLPRRVTSASQFDEMGRVTTTHRIVEKFENSVWTEVYDIQLSTTAYNSIGKVDYSIDEYGNLTKYEYDKTGNLVETSTYHIGTLDPDDRLAIAAHIADPANILTASRTLYDAEVRTLVSVGPYEPAIYNDPDITKWPVGSETVYDSLGRVSETRRWPGVAIYLENVVSRGKIVGKQAIAAANACTTTPPTGANIGWTSNGLIPVAKAAVNTGEQGPLSYSRSIYDAAGRVVHSITLDETGAEQPTSYIYDMAGKQLVVIDPLGHTMALATNNLYGAGIMLANGTVAQKLDFGVFSWHTYDETNKPQGNLTGTHQTTTHYDGHQRDRVTDARGNTTSFGYDDAGRLIWTKYPQTQYVTGFGTDGSPVYATSHTYTHTAYNSMGQRAWESEQTPIEPDDSVGLATVNKKEFRYDSTGRLTMVILPAVDDPEDSSSSLVHPIYRYYYDQHGNQTAILDPKGRATTIQYDEQNRQTRAYMPYLVTFSPPVDLTDPAIYLAFDTIDDIPAGQKFAESHYDAHSRIQWQADCKGQVTGFFYDSHGRLECKKLYTGMDAYSAQTPSQTVRYTYDALGRRHKVYVDNVLSEEYGYTADGSLAYITYSGIGTVNYEYDPITGQKLRTVADDGTVTDTQSTYDGLGRLATVQGKSDAAAAQYAYDAVGSRESLKYANGNFAQHNYDPLNRLSSLVNYQTKPINGQPAPPVLSSFSYGLLSNGRRACVDEMLVFHGTPDPITEQRRVRYDYDNLNRLVTEAGTGTAGSPGAYTGSYLYDILGNRKMREVTANGQYLRTIYSYDDETDRLLSESHTNQQAMLGDKGWYAYADGTGGYKTPGSGGTMRPVSSLKAFFFGLPTFWSLFAFVLILVLLPVVLASPAVVEFISLRFSGPAQRPRYSLSVFKRGVCVLLAYVMLVGPGVSEVLAYEGALYFQCQASDWGISGQTIEYTYNANGAIETKTTKAGSTTLEVVTYTYDLRNRLCAAVTDHQDGWVEHAQYACSDSGIRLSSHTWTTQNGGAPQNEQTKLFLIDENNGTGYAQVLEEKPSAQSAPAVSYTIGDDILGQSRWDSGTSTYASHCLLYDGHGSTRQLSGAGGTASETYSYDAYGVMLGGGASSAGTSLLYCGEMLDEGTGWYYNRARFYDPATGRFNKVDPYAGNMYDPLSLHKYIYCHNDPVNAIDPSGMFTLNELMVNIGSIARMMMRVLSAVRRVIKVKNALETVLEVLRCIRRMHSLMSTLMSANTPMTFGTMLTQALKEIFELEEVSLAAFWEPIQRMFDAVGTKWQEMKSQILRNIDKMATEVASSPALLALAAGALAKKQVGLVFNLPSPPVNWGIQIPLVSFSAKKLEIGFRADKHAGRLFGIEAKDGDNLTQILRIDYWNYETGHWGFDPHFHVGPDADGKTHHEFD